MSERTSERAWRAVETIYHAYLTGLILHTVTRRSAADATELVFRTFRAQHLAKFLPGLEKLGLRGIPDAVACARYHYLANFLGGVGVEYVEERATKAWVRYPPPRWIWWGTAVCGIPSEVSRAMLRAGTRTTASPWATRVSASSAPSRPSTASPASRATISNTIGSSRRRSAS